MNWQRKSCNRAADARGESKLRIGVGREKKQMPNAPPDNSLLTLLKMGRFNIYKQGSLVLLGSYEVLERTPRRNINGVAQSIAIMSKIDAKSFAKGLHNFLNIARLVACGNRPQAL